MTGIDPGMFELFREEVRSHTATLGRGLIDLEGDPGNPHRLEPLMRAAHSLKGAARIVGVDPAVRLAHVMEDALVAAQAGSVRVGPDDVDALLRGADVLSALGALADAGGLPGWVRDNEPTVDRLEPVFRALAEGAARPATPPAEPTPPSRSDEGVVPAPAQPDPAAPATDLPNPPTFDPPDIPADPLELGAEHTMLDLFREETRRHLLVLDAAARGLVGGSPPADDSLDALRQLRGAALLMRCEPVAGWSGAVGTFLQTLRGGRRAPSPAAVAWVRFGIATVAGLIGTDEETYPAWVTSAADPLKQATDSLRTADVPPTSPPAAAPPPVAAVAPDPQPTRVLPLVQTESNPPEPPTPPAPAPPAEAVVRVTAQSLNRLMGLAGESLVQARWLHHFSNELGQFKKRHEQLAAALDAAFHAAAAGHSPEQVARLVADARHQAGLCRHDLLDRTSDFDDHSARAEDLNTRLYREVIASRMRPFADGLHGLPRLVRDMARSLGKQARLVIEGEQTDVDRDVLDRLEAPLTHLVRNAVDHGLEPAAERARAGKPAGGTIRVHAWHRAGMLSVSVADDGGGIDLDRLRARIVARGHSTAELVRQMTEAELLEFLFLPGFTTAPEVTEFSGRGVGLDVVQDTVRRVGGSVRITTRPGLGTTFHLQLPITLSVIRAVVVEIAGEAYAFPHTRIDRLLRVPRGTVRSLEHRQFIAVDGLNVGLVLAGQLLELPSDGPRGADLPVVLLSDSTGPYGLIVDAFRGEQDLVVRPLDPRLGKVANLSAAAILDTGDPVLIVDVEDLVRSMDQFIQTGSLRRFEVREVGPARKKRVLVVDDSITVREVERQLLAHKGYDVLVAVDGVDGWNQVRVGRFDLLVTDVDMPRMTGLQLVQAVRADDRLRDLPVVIVSYKERDEDRARGLEVGANYYLTKSSFHDNRFVQAVEDLIGKA
jgi:two-component system sensor histidine kinase and response regulator WspE